MTDLAIPYVVHAEEQVAAGIVSNPRHVRGVDALNVDDFYTPYLGRLFGLHQTLMEVSYLDERISAAAHRAGIEETEVARLVSATTRMWTFDIYVRQIQEAACRRRVMATCLAGFNGLGQGEPLEDVVAMLRRGVGA